MRIIIFCCLLCLPGCVREITVPTPVCPVGVIYLTENDRQVISDMLVDEILANNLFCEELKK